MSANPYAQGWREWDERYAALVLGKRNWQIAAGCSLLVSFALTIGIVWLALRSRYVPHVVVTDRLGQAITIPKPLTAASMPVVAARSWTAAGTPEQCREDLRRLQQEGARAITLRITSWDQEGQLLRLINEVLPKLN